MVRTPRKSHLTTKGLEVFPVGGDLEILGEQYLGAHRSLEAAL